jgi:hypothetical protein
VSSPVVRHVPAAPQVPGSNPRWGEFREIWVKKTPRSSSYQSTGGPRPNSHLGDGKAPCMGGGGGSGVFSPGEMALSSYLKAAAAVLSLNRPGRVFLECSTRNCQVVL